MKTNLINSVSAITTQPTSNYNEECMVNGINVDRLCHDPCVACSFLVPSYVLSIASSVSLSNVNCIHGATSVIGGVGKC